MTHCIPNNEAEFLAKCQAKIHNVIKIGPVFSRLDDTGELKIAFKIAGPEQAEWTFVKFAGQGET